MTEITPNQYWISPGAVFIKLNAMSDADYIQANVASGAMIMAYCKGLTIDGSTYLGYDAGHNYQRWPLLLSPTLFGDKREKYMYAAIPKTAEVNAFAVIVFPNERIDVYGKNEAGVQVGDTNYLYIFLQGIISASEVDGVSQPRTWTTDYNSGTLASDEAISGGGLGQWYEYNTVNDTVTFIKDIARAVIYELSLQRLSFGNRSVTGFASYPDTAATNDSTLVTPRYVYDYVKDNFLSKTQEDTAQGVITFLQGIFAKAKSYFTGIGNTGDIDNTGNINNTGGIYNSGDIRNDGDVVTRNLTVTGKATFFELEILKAKAAGGMTINSPGTFHADLVEETGEGYVLYQRAEQDGKTLTQMIAVSDQLFSCDFNLGTGNYTDAGNHYYWRLVTAAPTEYVTKKINGEDVRCLTITLDKTDCAESSDVPKAGDDLMVLGHRDDNPARQNAIMTSVYRSFDPGLDCPYTCQYSGINGYNLTSHRRTWFAANGNRIEGDLIMESTGGGTSVKDALDELNSYISEVGEQVDDKIQFWFFPYQPSADTAPTDSWTTDAMKDAHVGDLFYDTARGGSYGGGTCYKWTKTTADDGTATYSWVEVTDAQTIAALEKIADISSDGVISGGTERAMLHNQWRAAKADYFYYGAQAFNMGLKDDEVYTKFTEAYNELAVTLNGGFAIIDESKDPLFASTEDISKDYRLSDYDITPSGYRDAWNKWSNKVAALAVAIQAATDNKVEALADDGIITAGSEKQQLEQAWARVTSEYARLVESAKGFKMNEETGPAHDTLTLYEDSYAKLDNIVKPILENIGQDTSVDKADYQEKWMNYYTAAANMEKALFDRGKTLTEGAQTDATAAQDAIKDIVSDGVISGGTERTMLHNQWRAAMADYTYYGAQALRMGLTEDSVYTDFTTAYNELAKLLNGGDDYTYTEENPDPLFASTTDISKDYRLSDYDITPGQYITPDMYRDAWNEWSNKVAALADAIQAATDKKVENLADDGIISAGTEKQQLEQAWARVTSENAQLVASAKGYGMDDEADTAHGTYNTYTESYRLLGEVVTPMLGELTIVQDTVMTNEDKAKYQGRWKDYYTAASNLEKALFDRGRTLTEGAQTDATAAQDAIKDIVSDGTLDPSEKQTVKRDFSSYHDERKAMHDIAKCGQETAPTTPVDVLTALTTWETSFTNLANMLNGGEVWNDTGVIPLTNDRMPLWLNAENISLCTSLSTPVTRDAYRTTWINFLGARTALLNAVTEYARVIAESAANADYSVNVYVTGIGEGMPTAAHKGDTWKQAVELTSPYDSNVHITQDDDGNTLYNVYLCNETYESSGGGDNISKWTLISTPTYTAIKKLDDSILLQVLDEGGGSRIESTAKSVSIQVASSQSRNLLKGGWLGYTGWGYGGVLTKQGSMLSVMLEAGKTYTITARGRMPNSALYVYNRKALVLANGTTVNTMPVSYDIPDSYTQQSVTEYYLATSASDGVTRGTSGWSTSLPTMSETNMYLWNYRIVVYSNGDSFSTSAVLVHTWAGSAPVGVTEYYLGYNSNYGVSAETDGWSTSPAMPNKVVRLVVHVYNGMSYPGAAIIDSTSMTVVSDTFTPTVTQTYYIDAFPQDANNANAAYRWRDWALEWVVLTAGEVPASEWTDSAADVLATGIDIKNRVIDVTADQFKLRNNSGEDMMTVDENGNAIFSGIIKSANFFQNMDVITPESEGVSGVSAASGAVTITRWESTHDILLVTGNYGTTEQTIGEMQYTIAKPVYLNLPNANDARYRGKQIKVINNAFCVYNGRGYSGNLYVQFSGRQMYELRLNITPNVARAHWDSLNMDTEHLRSATFVSAPFDGVDVSVNSWNWVMVERETMDSWEYTDALRD